MKKNLTFFIVGYYGAGNLGDELILDAILERLTKITDISNICITSINPADSKKIHGNIKTVRSFELHKISQIIKNSSLVIIGGGEIITDNRLIFGEFEAGNIFDSPRRGLSAFFAYTLFARIYKVPYILLSIGLSKIDFKENHLLISEIILNSKTSFFRDKNSLEKATELISRSPKNLIVSADPVFLRCGSVDKAFNKSKKILISVREWPAFNYSNFAKLLENLVAKGYFLEFVPFQTSKGRYENDLRVINRTVKKLPVASVKVLKSFNKSDISNTFKSAYAALGMRYHFLLLALCNQKPIIGLSYSQKINNLLDEFSLGKYIINDQNNPSIIIDNLEKEHSSIQQTIKKKLAEKNLQAKKPFDWINSYVPYLKSNSFPEREIASAPKTMFEKNENLYKELLFYKKEFENCKESLEGKEKRLIQMLNSKGWKMAEKMNQITDFFINK